MFLTRFAVVAIIGVVACVAAASPNGQPLPRAPVITCTNPYSGATWQIAIDVDHATADSYPAKVSDTEISWHDDKEGGNYTLNRKTGDLSYVGPSSTGGYFLHDHCGLPP